MILRMKHERTTNILALYGNGGRCTEPVFVA